MYIGYIVALINSNNMWRDFHLYKCNYLNSKRIKFYFSDLFSALKSSIACPSHHLNVLLRQTDLDESTIHLRYMKFRQQFPTGFIGPQAMVNLCSGVLGTRESEAFVERIFSLYGRNRKGWNTRLIGFREVILATENIHFLTQPEKIMRWIFKIHDYNGKGYISVYKISVIVDQILE